MSRFLFPWYFLRFSAAGWFIFTFDITGRRKTRPLNPRKKYADLPLMRNSYRAAEKNHEISKSQAIKLLGKPVKETRPKYFPVFRYIDIHFHQQTETKILITKHGGYKAPVSEWVDKANPTTVIMDWFCCFMFFPGTFFENLWSLMKKFGGAFFFQVFWYKIFTVLQAGLIWDLLLFWYWWLF